MPLPLSNAPNQKKEHLTEKAVPIIFPDWQAASETRKKLFRIRHSGGFTSGVVPDALRVNNANLFQTDLCRTNRQDSRFALTQRAMYKDVHCESRLQGRIKLAIHGTGYPLPGEYDGLFCFR